MGVETGPPPDSVEFKRWRTAELCIWLGAVYSVYNDIRHGAVFESLALFKDSIAHIIDDMQIGKKTKKKSGKTKPRKKRRAKKTGDG